MILRTEFWTQEKYKVMEPGFPIMVIKNEPWPGVRIEEKQKGSQWAQICTSFSWVFGEKSCDSSCGQSSKCLKTMKRSPGFVLRPILCLGMILSRMIEMDMRKKICERLGLCVNLRTLLYVTVRKITLAHCIECIGQRCGWKSGNRLLNYWCIPCKNRWWPQQDGGSRTQRHVDTFHRYLWVETVGN